MFSDFSDKIVSFSKTELPPLTIAGTALGAGKGDSSPTVIPSLVYTFSDPMVLTFMQCFPMEQALQNEMLT